MSNKTLVEVDAEIAQIREQVKRGEARECAQANLSYLTQQREKLIQEISAEITSSASRPSASPSSSPASPSLSDRRQLTRSGAGNGSVYFTQTGEKRRAS